ncbi:MAG TPA: hypothetical protein DEP71_05155 [Porphyromonadaceae bacterium]|jgi:hypothetical protein|uniref:Uncharacterized protein n=1 Tax=bioreactor metagenome TaxID=1076179 RepID=A0A644ZZ97_9ZZZZ|nr:hypothetical protein [Petrimonas sp.]BBD44102.1 Hypothetical protein PEIBARAKI_4095 [Petrimonas sp. IBARAKI]HAC72705.1 hypothetical protein [Porphyromonadaceae bacterium]MDD4846167.1 hypothetical protein [Petrimonas sp.]MEA4995363.1 hypothetical protein [Petrimonas sp.]
MKKVAYLLLALTFLVSCAKSKEDQVLNYVQKTIGEKPSNVEANLGDILYEFEYVNEKMMLDLLNDFRISTNGLDKIMNKKHENRKGVIVSDASGRQLGTSEVNIWETRDMTTLLELFSPTEEQFNHKINVRVISK